MRTPKRKSINKRGGKGRRLSYTNLPSSKEAHTAPIGERIRISSRAKQLHTVIGRDLFGDVIIQGDDQKIRTIRKCAVVYFESTQERIDRMLAVWDKHQTEEEKELPAWMT